MTEVRTPVAAPLETVTPIKPSEALRLGRLVRPLHITGQFFDGPNGEGACALGAMHIGWGGRPIESAVTDLGSTGDRLQELTGVKSATLNIGCDIFDEAEHHGYDGDAAVLAYLESRGL